MTPPGLVGVPGVTGFDAIDGRLVPTALVAVTVNVYGVPLLKGLTTAVSVVAPTLAVTPPGDDVTV
jgi:hypothetical protein